MGEEFDQADMKRFMDDIFQPHLERVDRHIEADDRRFETLNSLVNRVTTSIEVGTAVQQSILAQSEKITKNVWVRLAVMAAAMSPAVAVAIAIFK